MEGHLLGLALVCTESTMLVYLAGAKQIVNFPDFGENFHDKNLGIKLNSKSPFFRLILKTKKSKI